MPALRRYAGRLGGADLADDLVQATVTRALEYEAAYRTQGAMAAWLRQILRSIAYRHYDRRKRYDLFCDLDPDTADDNSDSEAEDFASTVCDATKSGGQHFVFADPEGKFSNRAGLAIGATCYCTD